MEGILVSLGTMALTKSLSFNMFESIKNLFKKLPPALSLEEQIKAIQKERSELLEEQLRLTTLKEESNDVAH